MNLLAKRGRADSGVDGNSSKVKSLLRRTLRTPGHAAGLADNSQEQSQHTAAAHWDEEDDIDNILDALPSDLMAAVMFLRSQLMPCRTGRILPLVILHTQLRSLLKDGTSMEREIDKLRRENVIRIFKLNTGPDEHAVLLTEDYTQLVRQTAADQAHAAGGGLRDPDVHQTQPALLVTASSQQTSNGHFLGEVAEAFCTRVLPCHADVSISHSQLTHLLSRPRPAPNPSPEDGSRPGGSTCSGSAAAGTSGTQQQQSQQQQQGPGLHPPACCRSPAALPAVDTQVSLLMQLGVLSRHPGDQDAYLLCVPGLGPVVGAITAGRRELQGLIGRRKYLEVPEKQLLLKTKLRRSPLGVAFHLRDLLGLGLVQRVSTTAGALIRLVHKSR